MQNSSLQLKQYFIVTGNYWAFTLTDGALRMLVVLHFYQLGYSPLAIASLFLFYEFFGVVTNLLGGWLGARIGLNNTMNIGLFMQIAALAMLLVPESYLTVLWVMSAQALSGIAKDLNKMSAKSSIKFLTNNNSGSLFKWVSVLTGSKNALKGAGFFLGGFLLSTVGFKSAILFMTVALLVVACCSLILLTQDLGKSKFKPKFKDIFSKSLSVNILSAARLFLFGSRDVWFVIALPLYMSTHFDWDHWQVGSFLATWIIGYGFVQTITPELIPRNLSNKNSAILWVGILTTIPLFIAVLLHFNFSPRWVLIIGLLLFGFVFAVNSSLHSYLIVAFARDDGVSLDVGFYYMANAMGRLFGTLLSGWIYQAYGIEVCLIISSLMLMVATLISFYLPQTQKQMP